jgi:hypothetical protein
MRTLDDVQAMKGGKRRAGGALTKLSQRYQWNWRVAQYDKWQLQEAEAARHQAFIDQSREVGKADAIDFWAEARDKVRRRTFALAEKGLDKIEEMMALALVRRKIIEPDPDSANPTVIIYEPVKWDWGKITKGIVDLNTVMRLACEMPSTIAELDGEGEGGGDDATPMFAKTSGQLEAAMPEGAVPPMPDDPTARPKLNIQAEAANSGMRQPARARPEIPRR